MPEVSVNLYTEGRGNYWYVVVAVNCHPNCPSKEAVLKNQGIFLKKFRNSEKC
jgi:hypothetical protein